MEKQFMVEVTIWKEEVEQLHARMLCDTLEDAHAKKAKMLAEIGNNGTAKVYTVITCDCGILVDCTQFTNTCDCGKDYNNNGDLLASRERWGMETGEHWFDCY